MISDQTALHEVQLPLYVAGLMKSGNRKAFTSHFVFKTVMMRYSIHGNPQSAIHHPKFRIIHCSARQLLAVESLKCELSTSTLFFTLFTGCYLVLTII